jgi:hypothetical protein
VNEIVERVEPQDGKCNDFLVAGSCSLVPVAACSTSSATLPSSPETHCKHFMRYSSSHDHLCVLSNYQWQLVELLSAVFKRKQAYLPFAPIAGGLCCQHVSPA